MPRIVILGTGTGVGKSYVARRLIEGLVAAQPADVVGIKPVETGIAHGPSERDDRRRRGHDANRRGDESASVRRGHRHERGEPTPRSDARTLERVSRGTPIRPHPLRAFPEPLSPHLAARMAGVRLDLDQLVREVTLHGDTIRGWQVIETAGGAFSPLNAKQCNVDLARALDPSIWVVVAPDALGVLHDVRATLLALRAVAREPDYLVLSSARRHDASAGTNALELPRVGLPRPVATLRRDDDGRKALAPLVQKLLRTRMR